MRLDESLMNDPTDLPLGEEQHRLSRRRMITASLGAVAGLVAASQVANASLPGVFNGSAGPQQNSQLQPAVRIPVPPVADGQIMFPIDALPGDCWISDNFGDCRGSNCSRRHEGLDISGNRGADLFAVVTGRLKKKYVDRGKTYGAGHGWTLHDETTDVTYKYFHMGSHAEGLVEGDIVQQGSVIGTVGNTGTSGANSDSNYHLHFEYRPGDVAQDPRPLLVRHPNCTFYD